MTRPIRRILAAGAVVRDNAGRFLLVRRGREPARGRWSVPGGRVEQGESLPQAAAREVLEETGLAVRIGRELWSVEVALDRLDPSEPETVYEIHDFAADCAADCVPAEPAAGDDADDARWFTVDELAGLELTEGLLGHFSRAGLLRGSSRASSR